MHRPSIALLVIAISGCMSAHSKAPAPTLATSAPDPRYSIHDMGRPRPPVVDPGTSSVGATPGRPPSDAIILFDGRSAGEWTDSSGRPAPWRVENGALVVVPHTGGIRTRRGFGDVQLHVEWMAPMPAVGNGQERGNSGVFLMGLYEVQVLDSYDNPTYADGQAAAVYGQYPPLVNASRPPGEWQTYDIIFHRPRFVGGTLLQPARVTVLHNGVLVQDDVSLSGPTAHQRRPPYSPHADRLPLGLQDHGNKVRYRNIWARELR